jgi:hypothetical protein
MLSKAFSTKSRKSTARVVPERMAATATVRAAKRTVKSKLAPTVRVKLAPKSRTLVVKVGAVAVEVTKPTGPEVQRNVKAGQLALRRAGRVFANPGVKLSPRTANAPLYYADPDDPNLLVQESNGKRVNGRFINGRFMATKNGAKAKNTA